jgi:hypothetical protein
MADNPNDKVNWHKLDLEELSDIGADDAGQQACNRILQRLHLRDANTPGDRFWAVGNAITYLINALGEDEELNPVERIAYLEGLQGFVADHFAMMVDDMKHDLDDLTESASETVAN